MHGTAGTVGLLDRDDSLVYVSERDREEHLFRKFDGYAISDTILSYLDQNHVQTVLIAERDTGTVIEYDLAAFTESGIPVTEEAFDPQTCAPLGMARRQWKGHAEVVL